ncbi:uncharacterized protein LOC134705666 [Mytilus trossulus]|uniref:uncharacterized protein LOC134705666 n=1 Tax=Mytilus trossulus TaxID=6551 RepID=UPI003004994F
MDKYSVVFNFGVFIFLGFAFYSSATSHYCYECSHSIDFPMESCINATDRNSAKKCSYGNCYTNIVYDKKNKSITSIFRSCMKMYGEGGCDADSKQIVCHQTCQEDYCNSKTNLLSNTGDKPDKSASATWNYCYECSHSTDSPMESCINSINKNFAKNCSTGFCYSNIVYDKNTKSITSMLRRCMIKYVEGRCDEDSKQIVCSRTCQEDYCNSKTNLLPASQSNTGHKSKYSLLLIFFTVFVYV